MDKLTYWTGLYIHSAQLAQPSRAFSILPVHRRPWRASGRRGRGWTRAGHPTAPLSDKAELDTLQTLAPPHFPSPRAASLSPTPARVVVAIASSVRVAIAHLVGSGPRLELRLLCLHRLRGVVRAGHRHNAGIDRFFTLRSSELPSNSRMSAATKLPTGPRAPPR